MEEDLALGEPIAADEEELEAEAVGEARGEGREEARVKISFFEASAMIMVALFFDVLDGLLTILDFLFGAGEFLKEFNNLVASTIFFFWFRIRGIGMWWNVASSLIEAIPFLGNTLPFRTVLVAVAVLLARRGGTKKSGLAKMAMGVLKK